MKTISRTYGAMIFSLAFGVISSSQIINANATQEASIASFSKIRIVDADFDVPAGDGVMPVTVQCGDDSFVIGGGLQHVAGGPASLRIQQSYPSESGRAWNIEVRNRAGGERGPAKVRAYAVCLHK